MRSLEESSHAKTRRREGRGLVDEIIEAVSQLVLTPKIIVLFGFKALSGLHHHSTLNCRTASIGGQTSGLRVFASSRE